MVDLDERSSTDQGLLGEWLEPHVLANHQMRQSAQLINAYHLLCHNHCSAGSSNHVSGVCARQLAWDQKLEWVQMQHLWLEQGLGQIDVCGQAQEDCAACSSLACSLINDIILPPSHGGAEH